jgi:hypothetical protein
MTPEDRDFDDDALPPDDEGCPNCGGTGRIESCFEDTCVCRNPPCLWERCDWCGPTR